MCQSIKSNPKRYHFITGILLQYFLALLQLNKSNLISSKNNFLQFRLKFKFAKLRSNLNHGIMHEFCCLWCIINRFWPINSIFGWRSAFSWNEVLILLFFKSSWFRFRSSFCETHLKVDDFSFYLDGIFNIDFFFTFALFSWEDSIVLQSVYVFAGSVFSAITEIIINVSLLTAHVG